MMQKNNKRLWLFFLFVAILLSGLAWALLRISASPPPTIEKDPIDLGDSISVEENSPSLLPPKIEEVVEPPSVKPSKPIPEQPEPAPIQKRSVIKSQNELGRRARSRSIAKPRRSRPRKASSSGVSVEQKDGAREKPHSSRRSRSRKANPD